MRMLCVHFNNRYTSDHQYFKKPDMNAFVFTVALQSILKLATNQFRESLRKTFPWNLDSGLQIYWKNIFIVDILLGINSIF